MIYSSLARIERKERKTATAYTLFVVDDLRKFGATTVFASDGAEDSRHLRFGKEPSVKIVEIGA